MLVLSTRLLRPTDIPELLFTTQRLLPDIGIWRRRCVETHACTRVRARVQRLDASSSESGARVLRSEAASGYRGGEEQSNIPIMLMSACSVRFNSAGKLFNNCVKAAFGFIFLGDSKVKMYILCVWLTVSLFLLWTQICQKPQTVYFQHVFILNVNTIKSTTFQTESGDAVLCLHTVSASVSTRLRVCVMLCWCVMTLHTLLAAVHTSSHHMVMTSESRIIKSFLSAQANLFTPGTHLHLPEPPQLPPLRTLFSPGWITSARAQQFHPPTSTWIDWLHTFCHTERKRRGGM